MNFTLFILGAIAGGALVNVIDCVRAIKRNHITEKELEASLKRMSSYTKKITRKQWEQDVAVIKSLHKDIERLTSENLRLSRALATLDADFLEVGDAFEQSDLLFSEVEK